MLRIGLLAVILLYASNAYACDKADACVSAGEWQLGFAVGAGLRTNPLVDGDHLPLVFLPDIAWYGERAYFDNGELGYQWIDEESYSVQSFVRLNREASFFSFWHPSNLFLSPEGLTTSVVELDASPTQRPQLSVDDIADRDWAVDGAIRLDYYLGQSRIRATLLHDVTNVHNGTGVALAYRYATALHDWRLAFQVGVDWKNQKLTNYYYGVGERDVENPQLFYQAKSVWQPKVSLSMTKPLTDSWTWLLRLSRLGLGSGISNSPIVEQNNVSSAFIGVAYKI